MSNEAEQSGQRRANLAALEALGVDIHPHRFDATHTVTALVEAARATPAAVLEAPRVEAVVAGRIVGIRSFGKASFLVLSDGRTRLQVYLRQDALSARDSDSRRYASAYATPMRKRYVINSQSSCIR